MSDLHSIANEIEGDTTKLPEYFTVKNRLLLKTMDKEIVSSWSSSKGNNISISIIVTSYSVNHFAELKRLLTSVSGQQLNEVVELILVIEKDKSLFEKATAELSRMTEFSSRVFYFSKLDGMSEARNFGGELSTGKILAFVDDDVVLDKGWVLSLIQTMEMYDAIAITGPSHAIWQTAKPNWFPKELTWIVGSTAWFDCQRLCVIRNAWGNNMAVRRAEFMSVGGFSTKHGLHSAGRKRWFDPPSEDVDLSLRLKVAYHRPVLYVPTFSVGHSVSARKLSWKFIAQRSYSVGYQRHSIQRSKGVNDSDRLSLESALIPQLFSLLPKSLFTFLRSPKNAMNIYATSFLVLVFALLGFMDRRPY